MRGSRWPEIERLCQAALERLPESRAAFLAEACGDDTLRREVESLLAQSSRADSFIETPALEMDLQREPAAAGLTIGQRVGVYHVVAWLGAGGMGEVYRARDTKLNRDVALKILPSEFISDPDRIARFKREAQVLASLNHPNIAAIFGLEEADGVRALVLELVDGPSLADRIVRGPIPLDEALPIARQLCEALEAAHEQGIVHRDLKPANIKVRSDGTVKVLDFGLAKALDPMSGSAKDVTASPTLTSPAMTHMGVILGTAAYMAPEQARGTVVDKRADIWAFGCVLYEMLTGRRLFQGDDVSITLASVLKTDPDWQRLPPNTPVGLRRLLRRCLAKDPKDRLQAIGDARLEIVEGPETDAVAMAPTLPAGPRWRHLISLAVVVLVATLVTGTLVWIAARSTVARPRVSRFGVDLPRKVALSISGMGRDVTLTPDGSRIVYIGANGTTLFVRPLNQLDATVLFRGGTLQEPFVSPDSQWVGFFEDTVTLRKVPLTGGAAVLVARIDRPVRGATWVADDTIIFATSSTTTRLQRVSTDGSAPTVLTRPDRARGETSHVWPERLPGGQMILYTVTTTTGGLDGSSIAVLDLRSGRSTILLQGGSHAQYVAGDHLIYVAAGTLRAVGFDPKRLTVYGTGSPVLPGALTSGSGAANAGVAADGTFVYVTRGSRSGVAQTPVWVDRQGHESLLDVPVRGYYHPRLAPDGRRVAVTVVDQTVHIGLWDVAGATLRPLTFGSAIDFGPLWTPDGRRLVFATFTATGGLNLFSQLADGAGAADQFTHSPNNQVATGVSPDGTRLVFTEYSPKTGFDVMMLPLGGPHQVVPLVQTTFDERDGIVSPDGRWLASEANDSGSYEVYVRPFPDVAGGHWQISTNGGTQPLWSRSGQELFYFAPDRTVMRVDVANGSGWTAGKPAQVLEGRYIVSTGSNWLRNYDIAADGQRFLMIKPGGSDATDTPPHILVIEHFDEELKRLAPTN